MGCDIHLYIEYRENKNSDWRVIKELSGDNSFVNDKDGNEFMDYSIGGGRNYHFFGFLAGVRSSMSPIYDLRGLPTDLSPTLKKINEAWADDAHSHGWLNLKEYLRVVKKWKIHVDKYETGPNDDWPPDVLGHELTAENADFWNVHNYGNYLIDKLNIDNILLGTNYKPEVRFIFWFDS